MKKYPIITVENFEELTDKYVIKKPFFRLRVRKPSTRQEFYEMTKNMFGVGLGFTGHVGSYEVQGIESVYAKLEVPKLWDKKYSQYDGLKPFLRQTFGELYCGGVAGSHYGQYKYGYRDKRRLEKLYRSPFVSSDEIASSR